MARGRGLFSRHRKETSCRESTAPGAACAGKLTRLWVAIKKLRSPGPSGGDGLQLGLELWRGDAQQIPPLAAVALGRDRKRDEVVLGEQAHHDRDLLGAQRHFFDAADLEDLGGGTANLRENVRE